MKTYRILPLAGILFLLLGTSCCTKDRWHHFDWPDEPAQQDTVAVKDTIPTRDTIPQKDTIPQIDTTPVKNPVIVQEPQYDTTGTGTILIVGGGSSGVCAGLQAARMGIKTILVEETTWLGGMLTAAGVSATDGNHYIRGGIFGEFITELGKRYGSVSKLASGWVSNSLFEPAVGEEILEKMCAAEPNLTVLKGKRFMSCAKQAKGWTVMFSDGTQIICDILIDCTELGDVAKAAGVKYRVGMDDKSYGNESMAVGPNDVVQDITMVMTLKDYGRNVTINKPEGYDETKFYNCCINSYNRGSTPKHTREKMMSYGHTPGGKYMINWPICGNDYYANIIELSKPERDKVIEDSKRHSLCFLYFMQTKLGLNTLGLADDEYPTADHFPFYPYYRESRRIEGEYLFTVNDAVNQFAVPQPAYRTGVAVGDYTVDHHHTAYTGPYNIRISFPKICPYSLPLGCMIPKGVDDMLVGEKSVSVTNIVNGSTRLQPVTMEIGQAAGALAALAIKYRKPLREVDIRKVQAALLESKAMLQPYRDCLPSNNYYLPVHRIASTGILRGTYTSGTTYFRPAEPLLFDELYLEDYFGIPHNSSKEYVTYSDLKKIIETILTEKVGRPATTDIHDFATTITRRDAAKLIDEYLNPFWVGVDINGELLK